MKWYKKQIDLLKKAKPVSFEKETLSSANKPAGRLFNSKKMGIKKAPKPGEKRSRPKTDSI